MYLLSKNTPPKKLHLTRKPLLVRDFLTHKSLNSSLSCELLSATIKVNRLISKTKTKQKQKRLSYQLGGLE